MKVLIDTSALSQVLRRNRADQSSAIRKLVSDLIKEFRVVIVGPIRQEILSGIADKTQFSKVKKILHSFEDYPLEISDYERAAEMSNICRAKGIQGSNVDFLICAVSERYHLNILTLDHDFQHYVKHLPIILFPTAGTKATP